MITNSISGLDSAFIRRFDVVLKLPVPPKVQREKILLKAGSDILSSESILRIASAEHAAPGVVTRACAVKGYRRIICNYVEEYYL